MIHFTPEKVKFKCTEKERTYYYTRYKISGNRRKLQKLCKT